ncbi:MAG: AMP-binding protein, partial [Fimbriimonadaceae bacterium]|nr:AMP-binding protein [Alphaproteobacteria bacterium]
MNIANWLHISSRIYPESPALMTGLRVDADYREFARRAGAIAAALLDEYGIKPGCRVGVYMTNQTRYLEVLYAIWWAGAVAVPINAKLHAREAAWIIGNAQTTLDFYSEDIGAGLTESIAEFSPNGSLVSVDGIAYTDMLKNASRAVPAVREDDDLAWIFYTSGTTGHPKGVMLTHGNLVAMSTSYLADVDSVSAKDAALYAAPISHGAGMYNFIHVRKGARHVVPESGGFKPEEIITLAPKLNNVSMFAAPTMIRRLVEVSKGANYDGEGIKTIVYGGGPMYQADILEALARFGSRFVQIYGQGESPMTITALGRCWHSDQSHPRFSSRLASVGLAQSVVEIRITDEEGNLLPADEIGEVEVRGATVMKGYWDNPKATNDALRGGWLKTGDVGLLDEDGFL